MQDISFKRPLPKGFYRTLRSQINKSLKEDATAHTGGSAIVLKSILLALIYIIPLVLMFFSFPLWMYFSFWIIAGIGMAGIGMGVMHDANHGSYSKNKKINDFLGKSIVLLCGNRLNWTIQHNVLHHTYTNIEGKDEDMDAGALIRLHPEQPPKKFHKFQYLYAPFLYSLLTLNWFLRKDFNQLKRYNKMGLLEEQGKVYKKEWVNLIFGKLLYAVVFLAVPIIFHPFSWYFVVLGFVAMHLVAGSLLSWVFQLAHVMEPTVKFSVNDKLDENEWAEHQLYSTINFSVNSKFLTWYTGGLNHQVEHHLFPNISHVHYPRISKIVRETAKEFDLPYIALPSLYKAIMAHFKYLKQLGVEPQPVRA